MAEVVDSGKDLMSTGNPGLDEILHGGLRPNRFYLVEGDPGAGKTTLGLQFLLAGAAHGERVMLISLSETLEELDEVAEAHGWSLDGVEVLELGSDDEELKPDGQYTVFRPAEVELGQTYATILERVETLKPHRIVVDSLSDLRLLSQQGFRYRRQVLALKKLFQRQRCTVLALDDRTDGEMGSRLHSLAHGVIALEQSERSYGSERRQIHVRKMRGADYQGGFHDLRIVKGGLRIFPSLVTVTGPQQPDGGELRSGVAGLDLLFGGGIRYGSSTLLLGPAGAGKTTVALRYAVAAAEAGEKAAMFLFDESSSTLTSRAEGLGIPLTEAVNAGGVSLVPINPASMSPGEFGDAIRQAVVEGARVVVIDSLNGYLSAMTEEPYLGVHLHDLKNFLESRGVATLLISSQSGVIGEGLAAPVDTTYLADAVMLFRFFEASGAVRQALSVLKKRYGAHERTIRELRIGPVGIAVGAPLADFHGVLTGVPQFSGTAQPLLDIDG